MAYNPNIPQATDVLSQSQQDLLNNFTSIGNTFDVNHVDFNAGADAGKHIYVEFPAQPMSPPITFPAGEMVLYSFLSGVTSQNEIYVNKTNQATVVQIPLTASILSVASDPGNNVSGWTYLPSGILLMWGNGTANGNTNITFPVAATVPTFTNVMSVQLTTYANSTSDSNTFVRLSAFTNTGFQCYGSARTSVSTSACAFQYLAIGY